MRLRPFLAVLAATPAIARTSKWPKRAKANHTLDSRGEYSNLAAFSYGPGEFNVAASSGPILTGTFGNNGQQFEFYFRSGDAQFFAWDGSAAVWTNGVAPGDCYAPDNSCSLIFGDDGNLVAYRNGESIWQTDTSGQGTSLLFLIRTDFVYVGVINDNGADGPGTLAWTSNQPFVPPMGPGPCAPETCS